MFTIKSTDMHGHNVYQCAAYRFDFETKPIPGDQHPELQWTGPMVTLMDGNDVVQRQVMVVQEVYVMNEAGRTVDVFRAPVETSITGRTRDVGGHPARAA